MEAVAKPTDFRPLQRECISEVSSSWRILDNRLRTNGRLRLKAESKSRGVRSIHKMTILGIREERSSFGYPTKFPAVSLFQNFYKESPSSATQILAPACFLQRHCCLIQGTLAVLSGHGPYSDQQGTSSADCMIQSPKAGGVFLHLGFASLSKRPEVSAHSPSAVTMPGPFVIYSCLFPLLFGLSWKDGTHLLYLEQKQQRPLGYESRRSRTVLKEN